VSNPTAPVLTRRCNLWGDFRRAIVCLARRRQPLQNQQPVERSLGFHYRIDPHLAHPGFMRKAISLEAQASLTATSLRLFWISSQAPGVTSVPTGTLEPYSQTPASLPQSLAASERVPPAQHHGIYWRFLDESD
jgi:hypothetical protein